MSRAHPKAAVTKIPGKATVAIVAARFNAHIVDLLLSGCESRLRELGLTDDRLVVRRVPGAFELPLACSWLAEAGFDAVIALGCVIRGDTAHFDYVAGEAARGISAVGIKTGVPIIFGVLTTETEQQAIDRSGGSHGHAGISAADAAAEMIALRESIEV